MNAAPALLPVRYELRECYPEPRAVGVFYDEVTAWSVASAIPAERCPYVVAKVSA